METIPIHLYRQTLKNTLECMMTDYMYHMTEYFKAYYFERHSIMINHHYGAAQATMKAAMRLEQNFTNSIDACQFVQNQVDNMLYGREDKTQALNELTELIKERKAKYE